jgi:phosphoribosylglycinamide formyltransferase 1
VFSFPSFSLYNFWYLCSQSQPAKLFNRFIVHNLVVFVSGSGSNLQAIINEIQKGNLQASVCGVLSDRSGIKALERAKRHDIPTRVLETHTISDSAAYVTELLNQLNRWAPDLIVLAGYLSKIPEEVIRQYEGQIINIHPSLLPKFGGKGFYGLKVHRAVLAAGETESGCTVHQVTEEYDDGPILQQKKVPVLPEDTPERLAARVLEQEHKLLPRVIAEQLASITTSKNS